MEDASTKAQEREWLKPFQIKPGQVLNPVGRPKGSRNKLGEAFVEALQADFNQHGTAAIVKVREEKPDAYLKVIASILPKDVNLNVTALDGLSDDDLLDTIASVRALATQLGISQIGSRSGVEAQEKPH
jgi:hypothetical protein